jgi:flagellin
MIGSSGAVSSKLASVYASNSKVLTDALTRLSSGKKIQSAEDDLSGFIHSNRLKNQISGYQKVREKLTEFKTFTSSAVDAGSAVYENLTRMKTLARQYASATDEGLKDDYRAEFESLRVYTCKTLSSTIVDGVNIMQSASAVVSVELDPQSGSTLDMEFSSVSESEQIDKLTIDEESIESSIDTEIGKMLTFLSEARAFDNIATQQMKLSETIINSKEALYSLITDIDDAAEMSKIIDLSVRQEASIAMIAQANMMQSSLSMLYDNSGKEGET